MLFPSWASVADAGQALKQHCVNVSRLLGMTAGKVDPLDIHTLDKTAGSANKLFKLRAGPGRNGWPSLSGKRKMCLFVGPAS